MQACCISSGNSGSVSSTRPWMSYRVWAWLVSPTNITDSHSFFFWHDPIVFISAIWFFSLQVPLLCVVLFCCFLLCFFAVLCVLACLLGVFHAQAAARKIHNWTRQILLTPRVSSNLSLPSLPECCWWWVLMLGLGLCFGWVLHCFVHIQFKHNKLDHKKTYLSAAGYGWLLKRRVVF